MTFSSRMGFICVYCDGDYGNCECDLRYDLEKIEKELEGS